MKKFFKPSSWEVETKTSLKFQPIKGNLAPASTAVKQNAAAKKRNKNKKKRNERKNNERGGVGPLAPKKIVEATTTTTTRKIKAGRIEKKKNLKSQKGQKQNMKKIDTKLLNAAVSSIDTTGTKTTTSSLEAKFKEQLMGGRFRFINEQLYTINSREAEALFRQDTDAFTAYHAGYRHQVEKWPMNPLDRIIKMIRKLPKSLEIADFGCGEARLAKSVPNRVISIDLVACHDDILACDMANTPLQAQSLDVAVYCLSLMGTNLNDYLLEANRLLKIGGLLFIAEIQSRFDDVQQFIRLLNAAGFELLKKDVGSKVFYFFQFQKSRDVGKVAILPEFKFKPCLYRKR